MSIHPSLRAAESMKRHRSVLSRLERIQVLREKGSLLPQKQSVLGLPKVKHLKIRVKKEKAAAAPEAAASGGAGATSAAPGAAAPAPSESAKPKK